MQVSGNRDWASLRVLVADDSYRIGMRLTSLLESIDGVELIGQIFDVPTAIKVVSHLKPDVLVVDYQMPGGTGLDVVRAANTEQPRPTIIMFTGHSEPPYRKAAMHAGADLFLDKSSDPTKFASILKKLYIEKSTGAPIDCNYPGAYSPSKDGIQSSL